MFSQRWRETTVVSADGGHLAKDLDPQRRDLLCLCEAMLAVNANKHACQCLLRPSARCFQHDGVLRPAVRTGDGLRSGKGRIAGDIVDNYRPLAGVVLDHIFIDLIARRGDHHPVTPPADIQQLASVSVFFRHKAVVALAAKHNCRHFADVFLLILEMSRRQKRQSLFFSPSSFSFVFLSSGAPSSGRRSSVAGPAPP